MVRIMIPVALVLLAFWIFSILDCAMQAPTRHRGVSKPAWILIVILLPVVGGVLWFTVGRSRASSVRSAPAPDDDPAFLGRIGSISDQDERIRRLEEELAALDAEDDANLDRPGGAVADDTEHEDDDPDRRDATA